MDDDPGGMASCRFFVMAPDGSDLSLQRISPFTIHNAIKKQIGNVIRAQRFGKTMILLEVANETQARKVMSLRQLTESITVNVTPHKSLNFSKGIIVCPELNDVSATEITENLKNQKVVETKRMTKKIKGEQMNTHSYLLTFVSCELPKFINAGYLRIPVRPFAPLPFRCHRCFLYNHQAKFCKADEKCFWCGEAKHALINGHCEKQPKCANCKQGHPSTSKICPQYIKEKAIKEIETQQKISNKQARELYEKSRNHLSYASVVKETKTVDSTTQTEDHPTQELTITQHNHDLKIASIDPTNVQTNNANNIHTAKTQKMKMNKSKIQPVPPQTSTCKIQSVLHQTSTATTKKTNKKIVKQPELSTSESTEPNTLSPTSKTKQIIVQSESSIPLDESIILHKTPTTKTTRMQTEEKKAAQCTQLNPTNTSNTQISPSCNYAINQKKALNGLEAIIRTPRGRQKTTPKNQTHR